MTGNLYIVSTPIGNLGDMTFRAVEILKSVDLIACEDTRVTRVLLDKYEIKKPTISYHQHSKLTKIDLIIDKLKSGENVAVVTDAGTPGISDPANYLVSKVREASLCYPRISAVIPAKAGIQDYKGIPPLDDSVGMTKKSDSVGMTKEDDISIIPIPGASALTAATSVSGMVDKDFYFAGFLPRKKGRQTELTKLSKLEVPVVIYESANRIEKTLSDIKEYFGGEASVFLGREMTKKFEEYWGGNVDEIIKNLNSHTIKGEFVVVVSR